MGIILKPCPTADSRRQLHKDNFFSSTESDQVKDGIYESANFNQEEDPIARPICESPEIASILDNNNAAQDQQRKGTYRMQAYGHK